MRSNRCFDGLLLILMVLTLTLPAQAAVQPPAGTHQPISQDIAQYFPQDPVTLIVDGQVIVPQAVPHFIKNGRLFGEMSELFNALGLHLTWEGYPIYRITAERDDLKLVMYLGYKNVDKYIYGIHAETIILDDPAFLATFNGTPYNKTVIPYSFVASAAGAAVDWNNVTRTVTVTSGRTYNFDWKEQSLNKYVGTYIHYSDSRYQGPIGCASGYSEARVGWYGGRWCADGNQVTGPFTQSARNACINAGNSSSVCNSNLWPIAVAESARGNALCPVGSTFDTKVKYCVETVGGQKLAHGPFPAVYRTRCQSLAASSTCNSDLWPADLALEVADTAEVATTLSSSAAIALFKTNPEVFGIPLENNDLVSAGLFSPNGAKLGDYQLSESVLPPFVLSGRRQTDSLVRTAYLLLPQATRDTYAFLLPDKVAQNPEAYRPYIQKKQKAIVVGTFMGPGGIKAVGDAKHQAVMLRHEREIFKLRATLAFLKSEGIPVEAVLYTIGDTVKLDPSEPNATAVNALMEQLKDDAQARYDRILAAAGLSHLRLPLSFGGDEMVHVAFARALNQNYNVYVRISNPNAKPRYDGGRTIRQLLDAKLAEIGLTEVASPSLADFEVHILAREPMIGGKIERRDPRCDGKTYEDDDWLYYKDTGTRCDVDRTNQENHDDAFMAHFNTYTAAQRAKTVIIDARANNGAWDKRSAPQQCDYLTYNAWGTGGNNIGFALAQAKLLLHKNDAINAKRLFLEAVAHDVFSNGYAEAQRSTVRDVEAPACGLIFNHHPGYKEADADKLYCFFNRLTTFVSNKMETHYLGTSCIPDRSEPFKVTAQMWRTFESEIHLWPIGTGEIFAPGVYRTGTIPGATEPMWQVLKPTGRGDQNATIVDLNFLIQE